MICLYFSSPFGDTDIVNPLYGSIKHILKRSKMDSFLNIIRLCSYIIQDCKIANNIFLDANFYFDGNFAEI